ncbi:MAG: hypothetical protein EP329_22535, partial [Deltaproteobacteria bacterium]
MSEPNLSDVIDRLDRLEAALNRLIEVVERQGVGRPAPAEEPSVAAAVVIPGPPPIKVAPPRRPA